MFKLWEKQDRDFSGFEWPNDQNGDPINWETPWLYLYGPTGTGKTTYARSWVQKWEGWEIVQCWNFADQLQRSAENKAGYKYNLDIIESAPRMVLDDLGSESRLQFTLMGEKHSKRTTATEIFENALEVRHRLCLRTIITSNQSPLMNGELKVHLGDPKKASRFQRNYGAKLQSRLIEMATIYNMQGDRRIEKAGLVDALPKKIELISKPATRSHVPILPELEDPYRDDDKPATDKDWREALRNAPPSFKPIVEKHYFKWKQEKNKRGKK